MTHNFRKLEMRKFVMHIESKRVYEVLGYALCAKNPSVQNVMYRQIKASVMEPTNTYLKTGTMWVREKKDFEKKFLPITLPIAVIETYLGTINRKR